MKKYHIYGIGNALVDIEVEVTDEELAGLGLEKGMMTLVDEARQAELLEILPGTHHKRACGGSAANSVIGAAKLGAKCFYSCKIASDEMGQFYAQDLKDEGVRSNLSDLELEPGLTGKCIVMVTPDADRTMNTHLGITGDLNYDQVDEASLLDSEWLYIEGYLVSTELACKAAMQTHRFAQQKGIKTAFSFSDPSMVKFFKQGLVEVLGSGVDLLFCNLEEALMFSEKDSLEEAFEYLKSYAKAFAITLGAKGALLWDGNKVIEIEPHKVTAKDSNGAGDLFAGAFLYGLTHGYSYQQSGKLASYASAKLVTEFGPRLSPQGMLDVQEFVASLE